MSASTNSSQSLNYHRNWTNCFEIDETGEWKQFYSQWWGPNSPGKIELDNALKNEEGGIIQVQQCTIWEWFKLLDSSQGWILLRKEYGYLYKRLSDVWEKRIKGALAYGQPGIGKSYFNVYALLLRMVLGKRVLFSTNGGITFLFDESGVWLRHKKDLEVWDLPRFDSPTSTSRIWSLVDAIREGTAETSEAVNMRVFGVLATSPKRSRYDALVKQDGYLRFVVDPWTPEELHLLLKDDRLTRLNPKLREPYQSVNDVEELVGLVGPCPRDVITYLENPAKFYSPIIERIERIASIQDVINLFQKPDNAETSHHLIIIRRAEGGNLYDDTYSRIKTLDISQRLKKRMKELRWNNGEEIFLTTRNFSEWSTLAGWTFEYLVDEYACAQGSSKETFHTFAQMIDDPGPKNKVNRFAHTCPEGSSVSTAENGVLTLQCQNLPSISLQIKSRTVTNYDAITMTTPELNKTTYYRPNSRTNPFFDSFFLDSRGQEVIIWVFQTTIAKTHGGSDEGVEPLKTLKQRFQWSEFRYVLVEPYQAGRKVVWSMPAHWKDVKGGVYVLYINVGSGRFPNNE